MYEVNSLDASITCRDAQEYMIHSDDLVGDLEAKTCVVLVTE
jgi:hypothetical protein